MSAAAKDLNTHPFLEHEVMINLSNGVDETLQMMASVASIFEKAFIEENWKPPADVSVYLEVQSPPSFGQIRFHFSRKALNELYKRMMNEEAAPDLKQIVDCVGEVSNVCYGYAKSKLNREGYSLGMALPRPGKTEDLPHVESKHPHMIIPFKVFNETCYIQIVIL